MGQALDRIDEVLAAFGSGVAAEVRRLLGDLAADVSIELQELRRNRMACRVRAAVDGGLRSLIIRRLDPDAAHRNRLVVDRWLPWIGLEGVAPALLGAAATPGVESIWQIHEDVGDETLEEQLENREQVASAVQVIAELHTRAAGHAVVAECRHHGRDLGMHYFTTSVSDALTLLEALRPPGIRPSQEQAQIRDRLRSRLARLLAEASHRARLMAIAGGPETMLHGDLRTTNVFVSGPSDRRQVRLIHWDRVGAGPCCYDLSTLLCRFPVAERLWVFERYRNAVALAGWRLPALPPLNLLLDTAVCARYANRILWPALALLHAGAEWAWAELTEIDGSFRTLEPVIPT